VSCGVYNANVTDESRTQIRALPHLANRFAKYPLEELAVIHSYFLLRKMPDAFDQ
jgi:hypothetical protein